MREYSFTLSCTSQLKNYNQLGKSGVFKESEHQRGSTKSIYFSKAKKMYILTEVEN